MLYDVGTRCWYPDKDQGWIGAEVIKCQPQENDALHLELRLENENNDIIKLDTTATALKKNAEDANPDKSFPLLRNPPILESTEDLTSLSYLNEPAVLHAIKQRYAQLNIYTYSGLVLIATNPFDRVDQLYSQDMIQAYAGKRRGEMEPHLFAIADEAYSLMKSERQNQTIVVSGESGAGKTVSAKYIMRYFASVEEEISSSMGNLQHKVEMSETEEKILATNPIMEAFGNAKTTRNDNSSRFGKYLEILFDEKIAIIGARLRTYLLERSRLVYQPESERNYHIFYQLMAGLSDEQKRELSLTKAEDFFYLNQGGEIEIKGIDDRREYQTTVDALSLVGINEESQHGIFKILAALLHIGNIEIKKTRNDASVSSEDKHLKVACELLQIDPVSFAKWITKRQITTRSEKIVSNLNYNQALVARDSVAKFIYTALFDWLVENINTVLCDPQVADKVNSFIGVLDIYGFEHFEKNSFEQFCINYANEKLQQEFNQHVFKLEQEEYMNEEIEWSFIEFNDNQPCIDLIENKLGLLSLLDEESRLPAGTDESWTQKIYQTLDKPPTNKVFSKPRFGQTKFVVKHYAYDVSYDTEGFIEKNRDTVSEGHLEVLKASSSDLLQKILLNMEVVAQRLEEAKRQKAEELEAKAGKKPGTSVVRPTRTVHRKPTLGSMFKQSLIELMDTINSTNVHYIRCIKPNADKEPWKFDNLMVLSQLRACGVLETIRISCAGFPSRWTFKEFILRYYILLNPSEYSIIFQSRDMTREDIIELCKKILDITAMDKNKYQIGKTKIFFKAGMLAFLENLRSGKMNRSIVLIQKHIRMHHYRRQYVATMQSIGALQRLIKGRLVRQKAELDIKNEAATRIQTLYRAHRERVLVTGILRSIIQLQSDIRMKLKQREMKKQQELNAAVAIQSSFRAYGPRMGFRKQRRCAVIVQSMIRRHFAMRQLVKLKAEAKSVKNLQEVSYRLENKVIELTENLATKVKENKEMRARIEKMLVELAELSELRESIETQKREYLKELDTKNEEFTQKMGTLEDQLSEANSRIDGYKAEIERLVKEQDELRAESKKHLEDLQATQKLLNEREIQNADLLNEVKTLKEDITRLQNTVGTVRTQFMPQSPSQVTASPVRGVPPPPPALPLSSQDEYVADELGSPRAQPAGMDERFEDNMTGAGSFAQINEELYRLLENTDTLNVEITEGLLKGFKVPDSGVSIALSRRDVVYPARILIIVLSEMWRFGLTKQSENFLAQVLITIQKVVTTLKGTDLIPSGAFWLANVRELYSFVLFARQSILTEENFKNDMKPEEYDEYVSLVTELKEDFESLSYNIYNIWLKKLQKELQKKAIPAIVMSESLPGFSASDSGGFLNKFFNTTEGYTMDDILTFFNSIYWCMRSLHIETEVFRSVVTTLLNYIDAICFNDLVMRRNFLSWKRGLQLNYNITRLEEWCKSHELPDGADCLKHLIQTSKLLQLRKYTIEDINILRSICSDLSPAQLQKLITQSHVADYESPIPDEILKYVADLVKSESLKTREGENGGGNGKTDIFLHVPNGPFEDPFLQIPTREFDQVEAYIPIWLNLPTTKRIVDLVAQNVNVME